MKTSNIISGIILLVLGVTVICEARKLSFGSFRMPGPGFFPTILGMVLAALSLILLGESIKEKDEGKSSFLAKLGNWKKIGMTIGALFACTFLFEPAGYLISVLFLIVFLLWAVESKKWWLVILVALLSSLVSYLVFGVLLGVPLPVGILGI